MTAGAAPPIRRRRRLRPVEVVEVRRLTDRMTSIDFAGELDGFEVAAPTQHVKLLVPGPGEHAVALPESGPDGPVWPEGRPRPPMRTYTPRRFDPATGVLEIQFVIHGDGPASRWAERAEPGDRLAIGGPGGRMPLALAPGRWLIAGDDSAVPAIGTLLDALPAGAFADVYVESAGRPEGLVLGGDGSHSVHWLDGPDDADPGSRLLEAVSDAPLAADTNVWVACEATAVRRIRTALLHERRADPERLVTRGYWKQGDADHPDHDFGEAA